MYPCATVRANVVTLGVLVQAALYDAMNAVLAQLHSLSPEKLGLEDYGKVLPRTLA